MNVAQDKGVTSQYGLGAELIVIAAVIVGGASILGGRGRVLGSCLGAILVVLIDKVLREGVPITRTLKVGNQEMQVQAMASLPPGAVPAFLGLILLAAVLIEPWIIRRKLIPRLIARLRGTEPPPADVGTVAIEAPRTHGTALVGRRVQRARPALVADAARGGGRDLHGGRCGCSASGCGRTSGAGSTTASTCSWPSPRSG